MAVVQNMVRLTHDQLEACRNSEAALAEVIALELEPPEDYLDLDWSPRGLELYFQQSGQPPEVQAALKLATDGARIVNPACSDPERTYDVVLDYGVYSHITELAPDEVQHVAAAFRSIDMNAFLTWLPEDISTARERLEKHAAFFPSHWHPNQYYREYLERLVAFYQTAAAQHWAVIMWWD